MSPTDHSGAPDPHSQPPGRSPSSARVDRRQAMWAVLAASAALGSAAHGQAQPAVSRSQPGLKALIVGGRRPGSTLTEHRQHIRQVHGELVLRYIAAEPDFAPQRYVQNPVFDGQFRAGPTGSDALTLGRDFVTQVWFPNVEALGRSRNTPYFKQHIEADERNFVDLTNVIFLPARERVVSGGEAPAASGAYKLFVFIRKAPSADGAEFARAWAAAGALASGAAIKRHVQNEVLNRPGAPALADGVDEFWLDDEASARSLLAAWQGQLRETVVRPGLAMDESPTALMAREDVVFAGRP